MKNCLSNAETLGYFRLDAEKTQLVTDASGVGLGAILLQEYRGETRVISYASRSLSEVERRYSTTEREALAVVWACEKFHIYLFGVDFELITDHKPLEVLYGPRSKPNARIERWLLKLMPYNFKIRYQPGVQNIADALSRLVISKDSDRNVSILERQTEEFVQLIAREATPTAISTRDIEECSKVDQELQNVRISMSEKQMGKILRGLLSYT